MEFFIYHFFSPDVLVFVFFGIFLGLKGSQSSSEEKEKKNKKPIRKRLGRGPIEHVCKISGSYLSKTACIFGLVCGKVQKSRLGIVSTWF